MRLSISCSLAARAGSKGPLPAGRSQVSALVTEKAPRTPPPTSGVEVLADGTFRQGGCKTSASFSSANYFTLMMAAGAESAKGLLPLD
jgi:hypothetical protein